jgi:alcohol dehydrogenase class IV
MDYEFLAPQRIRFGWGCRREVGRLAAVLGTRAFLVSGSKKLAAGGALDEIEQSLRDAGVIPLRLANISREPEVGNVDAAVTTLRSHGAGARFGAGGYGGSAIDLAKAAAASDEHRGESVYVP